MTPRRKAGLIALTRPVSKTLDQCQLSHVAREPIDLPLAKRQHTAYEALLKKLGAEVVRVDAAHELPDAVFVEDCAVVVDELAVITRPGARSRQPEVEGVAQRLAEYRTCVRIDDPGTLDGGDVVVVGHDVYIGRSSRTNDAGIQQLRDALSPFEYEVTAVEFGGALHLKSVCTVLGASTLLADPRRVDVTQFREVDYLVVPGHEWPAANTVTVNGTVVLAAGFPDTAAMLEANGLEVRAINISEFQKAEGAVSCKSILFHA